VVGRTVYDAYALATGVLALIGAAEGAELRRESALDLLRSRRFDVLLGQQETEWIDFKREGYAKTDRGKLELAKDVASFANAGGGILVLGVATTKAGETDTASAVIPCARGSISAQSYRALIGRRIHPPPERVEIFSISADLHGDVWVVSVPPQPEEYKPFLVYGAVVGGKVNDAYYSIVVRRDDGTVPTNPQAVHALLSAGRAALRASL
jgi:predicted HTH transcriptional regulator